MSESAPVPSVQAAIRGRWQIPALLLGLSVFAAGLGRMISNAVEESFAEQIEKVHLLRATGELTRASAYLLKLLQQPDRSAIERGRLHQELATTIYAAERPLKRHDPGNVSALISNFKKAVHLGVEPTVDEWIAIGDAYLWSKQEAEAVESYRLALRHKPGRPDVLRRRLVELQLREGNPLSLEMISAVEAILKDPAASPENYLWALERQVMRLQAAGDAAAAMSLVAAARNRLAGTEQLLAVRYVEALCLNEAGLAAEAEEALRVLREDWPTRDELWAKTGWLLGRIQQEEDRPQAALSFYEDVLRTFQTGRVNELCTAGQAECLAALGRHRRALQEFGQLRDRFLQGDPPKAIDRQAFRSSATLIGENLWASGDLKLGLDFLQIAMDLVDVTDARLRVHYLSRLAMGCSEMAKRAAEDVPQDDKTTRRARRLNARAAELYGTLASLQSSDDAAATRWLEEAATSYELAGMPRELSQTLTRLVRTYPQAKSRANSLARLGQLYQAGGRYDRAIVAYEEIIATYPRSPEALGVIVPMADALLALGGDSARRGVKLLTDVVEDRGPDPLFSPAAREYRQALFRLAEHYSRADDKTSPNHLEQAISRLEDALSLYPEDSEAPRLRFLLADAYRKSAGALREASDRLSSVLARKKAREESRGRLGRAADAYGLVIAALAGRDSAGMSELEQTYLRSSYLYRGDCFFDLERFNEALETFREAAWRYENSPVAISAVVQIVHTYRRLGELDEAQAALARLGWLLKKTPASEFDAQPGMASKAYWEAMVSRLDRMNLY